MTSSTPPSPTAPFRCRACGHAGDAPIHRAREMMLGLREPFDYLECPACGSLQIATIPPDLARFYPADYYSYGNLVKSRYSPLERFLKHQRARYWIEGRGLLGRFFRNQPHWPYFDWFRAARIRFHASILDIGAGRGDYLLRFASDGFTRLLGIDPYLPADVSHPNGVRILKKSLDELTGSFDFIWMHHSLEHFDQPATALLRVAALLNPGGAALIAVPLAGCWAWREFGVHWYQLDTPRHLLLPTPRALDLMARAAGLSVEHTLYYSDREQIRISTLYSRDIPLNEARRTGQFDTAFSASELRAMDAQSIELNARQQGDQACFILRKPVTSNP